MKQLFFPLHKDGSLTDVKNYRGISLLNVISKVFTDVLNKRLMAWAQISSKFKEEQAGYRVGYSTVDQIFTFYTVLLLIKYLKFYCILWTLVRHSTKYRIIYYDINL